VPALEGDVPRLAQAPLWGFASVLALEHPELRCLRLDLDAEEVDVDRLVGEIRAHDREDRVVHRRQRRYVARLQPANDLVDDAQEITPRPDATYLITGGLGPLGLATAEWLIEHGARHLLLMGRRGADSDAEKRVAELRRTGAEVKVLQADVADPLALERALEAARGSQLPLRGVVHAAGVLDDGVIEQQSWERFAAVMAPKVDGGWLLHELTRPLDLDFFVSFSSLAAVFGSPGQSSYAAANAFLDALAHYQRRSGQRAFSIDWAAWAGLGMAARSGADRRGASIGLNGLSQQGCLDALGAILRGANPQVAVADVDWSRFRRQFPAAIPPLMDAMVPTAAADSTSSSVEDVVESIRSASQDQLAPLLDTYLRRTIGRIMGLELEPGARTRSLTLLGVDSLMALDLKKRIGVDLGVDVPVRHFIGDGSDLETIAELLSSRMRVARLVSQPGADDDTEDREVFTV
jgi:NAD(P)-dependent dehydrogenase (short-subunit alcohol dehydrogenase family)